MRQFTHSILCLGVLVLAGCATLTPGDYGFRRVVIGGEDRYCAPRDWVVPPVVAQEEGSDPMFPLYRQFLALPDTNIDLGKQTRTPEVCITQAQWPDWLTIRTQWNRYWPVTPGIAEDRAAQRDSG